MRFLLANAVWFWLAPLLVAVVVAAIIGCVQIVKWYNKPSED